MIIGDTPGHKSLKALRAYERTSTTQQKTVGESLNSGKAFVEKENALATCSTPKASSGFVNAIALMAGKI